MEPAPFAFSLWPRMTLFALASLAPVGLLALGVVWGGIWALAAVLYLTLVSLCLDQAIPLVAPDAAETDTFPAADSLLAVLAVCHLVALPLAVWAIADASGLGFGARVALFVGFGMFFGQVMNPAAQELIHRSGRGLFRLGMAVYTSFLFGHHTSAHRLVHHRHTASADDPNTARGRESFYRFALRAWAGSFRAGWRRKTRGGPMVMGAYTLTRSILAAGDCALAWPSQLSGQPGWRCGSGFRPMPPRNCCCRITSSTTA